MKWSYESTVDKDITTTKRHKGEENKNKIICFSQKIVTNDGTSRRENVDIDKYI